jgi:hypothetical protein
MATVNINELTPAETLKLAARWSQVLKQALQHPTVDAHGKLLYLAAGRVRATRSLETRVPPVSKTGATRCLIGTLGPYDLDNLVQIVGLVQTLLLRVRRQI